MECLFSPDLTSESTSLILHQSELKHLRALRLRGGERIALSNGTGLIAHCRVEFDGGEVKLLVEEIFPNFGERSNELILVMAVISDRDRLEFALEKGIELGVTDFVFFNAERSQRDSLNIERLHAKSLSAMKQSKRSCLPSIHHSPDIQSALQRVLGIERIILTDFNGKSPTLGISCPSAVVIGPEGALTKEEISIVESDNRTVSWTLGERRLRAETAAVVALSLLQEF